MSKFINPDGSKPQIFLKVIKRALFTKNINGGGGKPAKQIKPRLEKIVKPVKTNEGVRLTWLGHSGWLVQLAGCSFLIDPILSKRIGGVVRSHSRFDAPLSALPKIDAILITHDHYDHCDIALLKKMKTPVIAGLGMRNFLEAKGIYSLELKWWGSFEAKNIKITFVPSKHGSRRGILDKNNRLWGGFIIETPGMTIYHAGDTAYFNGFTKIKHRFKKIDIALLPIGAYAPEHDRALNHLTPEQAIQAYDDLKAKYFFPMHWGTFKLSDEDFDEPPARLKGEWQKRKFDNGILKIMPVGKSIFIKNNR